MKCEICGTKTKWPMIRCPKHLQKCEGWLD